VNLSLKNYEDARADGERAATLRDTRGVILDLQMYALLEQIYGRLGNKELASKYAALSRVTPRAHQRNPLSDNLGSPIESVHSQLRKLWNQVCCAYTAWTDQFARWYGVRGLPR